MNLTRPQQLELETIEKLLPPPSKRARMALLEIGMPTPAMSMALRDGGGVWYGIARSPEHAKASEQALEIPYQCLGANGSISYEKHMFDVVVVALDMLTAVPDPLAFIRECNRVLRPTGLLIISVQTRRLLSLPTRRRDHRFREGSPYAAVFTETSLFRTVKNGFDIVDVESFSRFFTELVRIRENTLLAQGRTPLEADLQLHDRYAAARIADRLLAFFGKGHVVTLSAHRRQWSARIAPVLADGRKLTQAVLFGPPD